MASPGRLPTFYLRTCAPTHPRIKTMYTEGVLTPLSSDRADEKVKHSKAQSPRLTLLYNDEPETSSKKSLPLVTTCELTPYDPS